MKKQKIKSVILTLLLIMIGFIVYKGIINKGFDFSFSKKYTQSKEIVEIKDLNNNIGSIFMAYKNKFIKCSKDGLKLIDLKGKHLWDKAFTMNNPKVLIKGEYIAVGDIKGHTIYLFNEKGFLNKIESKSLLIEFDVTDQGVLSVLEENNNEHNIMIYNKEGITLYEGKTILKKDGYPMALTLANEGNKLITSYFYTDGFNTESKITYYNLSSVGENYADFLVGAEQLEDTLVPYVKFIDKETIILGSNHNIFIKKMTEKPIMDKTVDIKIEGEIKSFVLLNDRIVTITKGEDQHLYNLTFYNFRGQDIAQKTLDFEYKKITNDDKQLIMFNDWECKIYSNKGVLKWEHKFDYTITDVIPLRNQQYLIVTPNHLKIIKLK